MESPLLNGYAQIPLDRTDPAYGLCAVHGADCPDDGGSPQTLIWVVDAPASTDYTKVTAKFTASAMSNAVHTPAFTFTVQSGKQAAKEWTFTVQNDTLAPVTTSNAKSLYNGSASIALTPVDDVGGSGVKATYYKVDSGAQQTGTSIAIAAPVAGSAPHTIEFWSVDNVNNTESHKTASFVVWKQDLVAPTTTSTALPYYRSPDTINLIATDNTGGSGIKKTYYKLDGGAQVEGTSLGTGGAGTHTLEMWSEDNVGNIENPHKTYTYVVDGVAPTTVSDAKAAYIGDGTNEYDGIATIKLTATDNSGGSGIKNTYYKLDGGSQSSGTSIIIQGPLWGSAPHSVTFWSVDKAGNTESAKVATFTVGAKPDKTPPTTSSNCQASYAVPGVIQVYAVDNVGGWGVEHTYYQLDGGAVVESMTVETGGAGNHVLQAWSVDRAGNVETHKIFEYIVLSADDIAPVTTSDAVAVYHGPATVRLTATDNSGLTPFTYYRVDDGPQQWGTSVVVAAPIADSVQHTIHFWSVDMAGNTEVEKSVTFTVNALPAQMTFSGMSPGEGATIDVRNPSISVTAEGTKNLSSATLELDGAPKAATLTYPTWGVFTRATGTISSGGLANGVHTVKATFTDADGAKSSRTWTFTVLAAADVAAPVTTHEVVINAGKGEIRLAATDIGGMGVASTYYKLDGGLQLTGTAPNTIISIPAAGSHSVEYWSVDLVGNAEAHKTLEFVIDGTPPTTTSNVKTTYTGTANITLTGSDNLGGSGLKATYYRLDGGLVQAGSTVSVAPPLSSDPASHTLQYWSEDNQGNLEATKTANFVVWAPLDGVAPTTISDAVESYSQASTITLTAVDNVGGWGVDVTYWQLDGGPQQTGTSVGTGGAGAHTLEFWSVDKAGNPESPHKTFTYSVASGAPQGELVVPTDGIAPKTVSDAVDDYVGVAAVIRLTATDTGAGVAHTYWTIDGGAVTEGTLAGAVGVGPHEIEFWSVDAAGNAEFPRNTKRFTISAAPDTSAPVTTSDVAESYVGSATIALTAADEVGGSGVDSTWYRVNGGPQVQGTLIVVQATSASTTATVEYWSVDRAGNVGAPVVKTFKLIGVTDAMAPSTSCDALASYLGGGQLVTFTAVDDPAGSGVAMTHYVVRGAAEHTTGVEQVGSTFVVPTTAGDYTVEFWSTDVAGNEESPHKVIGFQVVPLEW